MAAGAVVGLVLGIADALDGRAAVGTGLAVAAVRRHARAESGHFFREIRDGRRNGEPTGSGDPIFGDDTAARGYYLESEGVHSGQTPPRETPG